jgi:PhzF family phenazine biosynthesis protein
MRLRIVDSFTARPFAGNPAGVVVLDRSFPDTAWLQQVAAEVNLAETAFLHPLADDPAADWALRWFTPTVEVDLCGHATLASAHILYGDGRVERADGIRFRTRSGVLGVSRNADASLTLDFPAAAVTPLAQPPSGLAGALGARPVSVHETGALGDLLVELADEQTVRGLRPDLAALAEFRYRGIIVTAAADSAEYRFVSRVFGPRVGVPEDPVTGSAHTALAPFWSDRLAVAELAGYQASARGGLVRTVARGDRVHITGDAVTVIDGTLLPAPNSGAPGRGRVSGG